ncbi:MAG: FAD-binding oxidoreductase [Fimbriimonadaceae bacterium]|nr:FAD-binding oxidoreductase [Chthonomonadaceae bacterium]MCO5296134.1 FAD-binding oxidoreductase [Fimbriimonadaceae bacterium]
MVSPDTLELLAEVVRSGGPWRIHGRGTKAALCLDNDASPISTLALRGLVEWSPNDQVVVVRPGTPIEDLQDELRTQGQCLPMPAGDEVGPLPAGLPGTVGGLVAMNLPHALQGPCGGVRDWVLGLTVVRPDGTIAKCGSHVVKNVAGYDVQKLMIGARGTLGVIAEVVLRTFPLRALPAPALTGEGAIALEHAWIQRTLRADFAGLCHAARDVPHRADEASSTLWAGSALPRFAEDWVLAPGREPLPEGPMREWMRRAKSIFDPDARLNPGAMGAW